MNKKLFKMIYTQITPSTTQWLPRYYTVFRIIRNTLTLDASCGTGDTIIELKTRGVKVIGINISKEEIMIARKKAAKEEVKIDLVIGDLTKAPFRDKTFGQIISLDTLEHIEDDNSVFQEFSRMLKSSGNLILSVPYGATNSAELFQEQRILRKLIPHVLYRSASFRGKSWLEATREDAMIEMGHLRDYSTNGLREKTDSFLTITHHEYALKKFASLATDITYGIRGFSRLKPFIFFIAVRLDRYFQNKKGYLLVCKFEKNINRK